MQQFKILFALTVLSLALGCSSQSKVADSGQSQARQGGRQGGPQGRPSLDEIFKMDVNNDGSLSRSEVKGPLLNDFARIDTDNNGLISRAELANAPKPERGQGPPRR